jgi:hypothetical protein
MLYIQVKKGMLEPMELEEKLDHGGQGEILV